MSGIAEYFHSEMGDVIDLAWVPTEDRLLYRMRLRGDPHRRIAYDYGGDVGIDPEIRPGEKAMYLRADLTSGIWLAPRRRFYPDCDSAFDRVLENRRHMDAYRDRLERPGGVSDAWLEGLSRQTGVPLKRLRPGSAALDRGGQPATIFLSYSSRNVMMARAIDAFLSSEGGVDVWFDLEQPGGCPGHDDSISSWLEKSVNKCQILALLLTRAALRSDWVHRELSFGVRKAARDPDFHFVVLKLEDMRLPRELRGTRRVVDCGGMVIGEILEDLYAAVYGRETRREWLAGQKARGWPDYQEPPGGYEHLESDGGVARALRWFDQRGELWWELEIACDGRVKRVRGSGPDEIVDPGIQPGDRVGFYRYSFTKPLWMRSSDLSISELDVISAYQDKLESVPRPWPRRRGRSWLARQIDRLGAGRRELLR